MTAGRPAVVVDTNVYGAELTRRGSVLAGAYREHVEGRELFISFVTVAELRYGARLAGWGEQRLRRLETRLGVAEVVWAGAGLVEAYVSLRHECIASGHPLAQNLHEADRWIAATARWLMCRSWRTMPCSSRSRRGSDHRVGLKLGVAMISSPPKRPVAVGGQLGWRRWPVASHRRPLLSVVSAGGASLGCRPRAGGRGHFRERCSVRSVLVAARAPSGHSAWGGSS